ncbi:MAG: TetR family transcriptional regulator [Rhizobacter sp.]|nr:TetR family transcriptional regulator [Rhizobacter sp.]
MLPGEDPNRRALASEAERQRAGASRRTQTERRSEAESKLLAAAREIVSRKGWVGMTLGEVGEAAGYSRGLAAHYFGSKPALLRALADQINENFLREIGEARPSEQGLEGLLGFVHAYLGRTDPRWTNTRALLILMAEATTDDSETGEGLALYNQSVLDSLENHFRVGIANGEIKPDVDVPSAAAITLGALRGTMLQKLLKDSRIELEGVRRELLRTLVACYATKPKAWKGWAC